MNSREQNVFFRLSLRASRQGENFLSESFALTLRTLAAHEPEVARRILNRFTLDASHELMPP